MQTVAAYIRVSTDDQLEYSPDSQLALIRDYAVSHGMTLPEAFIFREADGISGRKARNRPEFQRMIAAAREADNQIRAILVWKFSRFARNQEESIVYKSLLRRERGITVISVSEPIAADSEFGSLIERIIEWMDGYYSTRLAGEVRRGMAERFQRGQPVSIAPFGYRMEGGALLPDPDSAPLVRMMFEDFAGGEGVQAIARKLNALGARTNRGGLWENRTVDYILHNPAYIGKLRWNPKGHTGRDYRCPDLRIAHGTHEAIISPALWEQVQSRSDAVRALAHREPAGNREPLLLQGLVRCSACGSVLCACGAGYQCSGYIHGRCTASHYIAVRKLNQLVLECIRADWDGGRIHLEKRPAKTTGPDPGLIRRQLLREYQKLERIRAAYECGVDTLAEYQARKLQVQERITALEHGAPGPEPRGRTRADGTARPQGVPLTARGQNLLLRALMDHIVFNRREQTVTLYYRADALLSP